MCDNKKEFIGLDWKDEEEKIERKNNLNEFEREKVYFLNNVIENYNSKISYFSIYKNTILHEEELMNKDLMSFTTKEIEEVMMKVFNTSDGYKRALLTFLHKYFLYEHQVVGNIKNNPMLFVNEELLKRFNKNSLTSKYIDKETFREMCEKVEKEDSLNTVIPVLLARYGITGEGLEDMRSVRFEDIDEINKTITVRDELGNIKQVLPIDNFFIKKIREYEKMDSYLSNGNNNSKKSSDEKIGNVKPIGLENYGYILKKNLKKSSNDSDIKENVSGIYNRFKLFSNYAETDQRISPNSLVDAAKLEKLLQMRRDKRITTKDIESVLKLFTPNMKNYASAITTLSKKYKTLTNEEVLRFDRVNHLDLTDLKGREFVNQVCQNIGFWV